MLVPLPITKPAMPKRPMAKFLTNINTFAVLVFLSFKNTQVSNSAGNASPNEDKHSAPNNDMNKSSLGIATANETAKKSMFNFNNSNNNNNTVWYTGWGNAKPSVNR